LNIIPALFHASTLALLSAAVPMRATGTSLMLAVLSEDDNPKVIIGPTPAETAKARSVHVLAFTSQGELLLCESEGHFSIPEWDEVVAIARGYSGQTLDKASYGTSMDDKDPGHTDMNRFIRSAMEADIMDAFRWKSGT
jgi:exosome complex component RRP46